jgi:hypothetical protein
MVMDSVVVFNLKKNLDVHLKSQRRGLQDEIVPLSTLLPHVSPVIDEDVVACLPKPTLELFTISEYIVYSHVPYDHGFDVAIGHAVCTGFDF